MHVNPEQVFGPTGVLNTFTDLRHSKVKYKFVFYQVSFPPSPSSLLKLPVIGFATDLFSSLERELKIFAAEFVGCVWMEDVSGKKSCGFKSIRIRLDGVILCIIRSSF